MFKDDRGVFVKPFRNEFVVKESFYSKSKKGVIRGMHFQEAPFEQEKLVCVIEGAALDVVVNLETGEHEQFILSEGSVLYIPKGYAHGFQALEDCTMLYYCSEGYSKEHDKGIRYDSFGYYWTKDGVLSERDKNHPTYGEYVANISDGF